MKPEEKKPTPEELVTTWMARLSAAEKREEKWKLRGEKIYKIYRSQASSAGEDRLAAKFNIFWSNVETLGPATYSRKPKVEVFRRHHDQDPVARVAGLILERALQYEIDCKQDFHQTLKQVVKDRLLPGRGCAWIRYEPTFAPKTLSLPTPEGTAAPQEIESLADEFSPVDYVYWNELLISPARTWADVRWIARIVPFTKKALELRFAESTKKLGGDIADVPCDLDPSALEEETSKGKATGDADTKRAAIYEIWDREQKEIIWVSKGYTFPLDISGDKLQLDDFVPCPMPLLATTTNDQLVPVPDYVYYQDQIRELDKVTRRIDILVGSLRLIGVYDSSQSSLATLLQGGMENKLVAVNSWAAFAEKGGLKGVMDFVPLEQVFKILQGLYESRDKLKQSVYEITGMADIVRGASVASETLGAQQIKAKFANLRLSSRQQQVAEFVTSILRIKAEIMCRHYSPETLLRISSADQILEVQHDLEKVQAQRQQVQMPPAGPSQPGQPPQPGQLPPQSLPPPTPADSPVVQQALALLKQERIRKYRIEVASDSMIELDEAAERERRTEFMSAVSNFMNSMKNVTAVGPEMVPVALEMLKFVVRGYSVGRVLEATIEEASATIRQRMAKPPPPQPPEALQVAQVKEKGANDRLAAQLKADQDMKETEMQFELFKQQMEQRDARLGEQIKVMQDNMVADREHHKAVMDQAFQRSLAEFEARQASASQERDLAAKAQSAQGDSKIELLAEGQGQILDQIGKLLQAARQLRKRVPIYDEKGDIQEVREEFLPASPQPQGPLQ